MYKNKITQSALLLALCWLLFSCGQNPNNDKSQANAFSNMKSSKEVWTIYKKQDTVFHVKRLLSADTGLTLFSYKINVSMPESASQIFLGMEKIANEKEAAAIKPKDTSFNWKPFEANLTLFVQIEPSAFTDEMQALNIRQSVEQKIETALKTKSLGRWIAGDLGPGGANMLFEVANIDNAISIILEVLSKNGLDKSAIIGRRINTEAQEWFYEVIYPNSFTGVFLTM